MTRRLSRILAMTILATALCADRATVAASDRSNDKSENGTLVARLSSGLRRTVTPIRFVVQRQPGRPVGMPSGRIETPLAPPVRQLPTTPNQFPQPPPIV